MINYGEAFITDLCVMNFVGNNCKKNQVFFGLLMVANIPLFEADQRFLSLA